MVVLVKNEEFNFVTGSILVTQTCPQQKTSSKRYFWSFPKLGCKLKSLFHEVMASCIFIFEPKIV